MRDVSRLGWVWLTLVALGAPAWGQTAPEVRNPQVVLKDGAKGASLSLEGQTPNLPDGTKLHVRMQAGESNVEAAFFMTAVTGERFGATKGFEGRVLAPLVYEVRVELLLSAQRRAISDLVRREWGLPRDARVILRQETIAIGTEAERKAFRLATIGHLLWFVRVAQDCLGKTKEVVAIPSPEDDAAWRAVLTTLRGEVQPHFTKPFDRYVGSYVVLHENTAVSELKTAMSEIGTALGQHRRGQAEKAIARLDRALASLERLEEGLLARIPAGLKLVPSPPGTPAAAPALPATTPTAPTAMPTAPLLAPKETQPDLGGKGGASASPPSQIPGAAEGKSSSNTEGFLAGAVASVLGLLLWRFLRRAPAQPRSA